MPGLREATLLALTAPASAWCYQSAMRGRATILMLHRFRDPANGVDGHDPEALRAILRALRRDRYRFVDLEVMLRGLGEDASLDRAIAFTIDDGYRDQAMVGAPVFREFDCPVTTFVTTGFLDGRLWFWWDRIEYVFRETRRSRVELTLADARLTYEAKAAGGFAAAQADFIDRCKRVADGTKLAAIEALAEAADVAIPTAPPPRYAPMTWDELRACEPGGMRFGPHTDTHPILARTSDEQSRHEITESWRRLRAEARNPAPVFCYPNGQAEDFSDREIRTLREVGLLASVVGTPGYADARVLREDATAPYQVPRYAYAEGLADVRQYVSGLERVKSLVRRAR